MEKKKSKKSKSKSAGHNVTLYFSTVDAKVWKRAKVAAREGRLPGRVSLSRWATELLRVKLRGLGRS